MVQYYWNPNYQNQHVGPPPVTIPSGRPTAPPPREESYIENILRLNRGKPGTFHFSFEHAVEAGSNTKVVRGIVEAAGRDHVILSDLKTKDRYLFPMIYFDFAKFDDELSYFPQRP
ncbi:spore coat protein GerQ [Filibacter tadaridae]|uniref:Spore coat protein GerQ n=1 Tax=Filibacter tadaridae TaxID=2483811 RepID=A0A3P5WWV8_9BACL|nr:spore coat protein GerQ [Filibacter tadaridae]VDC19363.1 Spore coat protein GerQ [Filibacter tadaridae]